MEASNITKLKQYSDFINSNNNNINDFIDYCIYIEVLDKQGYCDIWAKPNKFRLNEIFNKIVAKGNFYTNIVLDYLKERVPNIEEIIEDENNFRRSTIRGGFPKLPPYYVKRESLAYEVKQQLQTLKWNRKLVIYGMMGYGKSCLINEVLNDKTLRKYFDNNVFWVNLGEHCNAENILPTMWKLYTACYKGGKTQCPEDVNILKKILQELFLQEEYSNALLVLDDVCSADVLDLFDIGCKTVITTQDRNIVKREDANFVQVQSGFSLKEALELFKLSLGTTKELPPVAEEVYNIAKGHPMLIALIGSYLSGYDHKDIFCSNSNEVWEYIKNMFWNREYRLNNYDESTNLLCDKIRNCVDKLLSKHPTLKSRFEDLAIFLEDVNIPPEVLAVLWNTCSMDVKNIMNKLAQKSLVVPFYHNDQQRFIYGIHDIHLKYLKEETSNRIPSIHKRLIDGYEKLTGGDYSLLPDDNYIFHFIGYHLYHAHLFDNFNIYFDLRFIEAKIKAVGKDDVLRDMEEYGEYITKNDKTEICKLNQYKDFIKKHGSNLFYYPKTDIIQYALQENNDNYLYKEALNYAKDSPNLYFKFVKSTKDGLDDFQEIHVSHDIICACFVDSSKHILVGYANGKIKLFYEQYEKEISSFTGHSSSIKSLVVSPDKNYFLSVGEDGIVYLWKFVADGKRNSLGSTLVSSPKTKQKGWQNIFNPDYGEIKPKSVFQKLDDHLVSANFPTTFPKRNQIITGSKKGHCMIWSVDSGQVVNEIHPRGYEILWVYMSDEEVIFSCDDLINGYKMQQLNDSLKLEFDFSLYNKDPVKTCFRYGSEIIVISNNAVAFWNINKKHRDKNEVISNKDRICVSSLTNDSNFLIVATDRNRIFIWDVIHRMKIREFKSKGLAKSLDTFYDENNSVHILLIGSDRKTLQQCHINPYEDKYELNYSSSPVFTPFWKKNQPFIPLLTCPENKIQVFRGHALISETEAINMKVTQLCLSACGDNVIYGLNNGELHAFNIKTKIDTKLNNMNDRGSINFLKSFDMSLNSKLTLTDTFKDAYFDYNLLRANYDGLIVAACDKFVTLHEKNQFSVKSVKSPIVFRKENALILVDYFCKVYQWDLYTNELILFKRTFNQEDVILTTAAFCERKNVLAIGCTQRNLHYLHVVSPEKTRNECVEMQKMKLNSLMKCVVFSSNGTLLVVGLDNGDIMVWNTQENYKLTKLQQQRDSVEQLLFFPCVDPILVSLSEEVFWWNLKALKKDYKPTRGAPPKSIEILDNLSEDISQMNIRFWCGMEPLNEHLLSCLRLGAKAMYISASNDFSSFLLSDEKGKIYIIKPIEGE